MVRKIALVLVVVIVLAPAFGCRSHTGYSPTQNLRKVMIAGEQLKIVGQDIDRFFGLEEYPQAGRWNY
jgi:hypothetical protein